MVMTFFVMNVFLVPCQEKRGHVTLTLTVSSLTEVKVNEKKEVPAAAADGDVVEAIKTTAIAAAAAAAVVTTIVTTTVETATVRLGKQKTQTTVLLFGHVV